MAWEHGILNASGNVTMGVGATGVFTPGSSTVSMSGGTPSTSVATYAAITMANGNVLANLATVSPGVVAAATAVTINGTLTINAGSRYDLNGKSHGIGALSIAGSATYTFPNVAVAPPATMGILDLAGSETVSGAYTVPTTSGTVRYHGITTGAKSLPLGNGYYNLVFDQDTGGISWTPASGNVTVAYVLNVHDGTLAMTTHNLTVSGSTIIDGGTGFGGILTNTSGTLTHNGGILFQNNFGGTGGNGLLNGTPTPALTASTGAVSVTGDISGSGAVTAPSTTTTITGGNLYLYDGAIPIAGTFAANGGTVVFSGTGTRTEYVNGVSFAALKIQGGITLQAVDNGAGGANALTVTGALTTNGTSDVMDVLTQNFTIGSLSNTVRSPSTARRPRRPSRWIR